MRYLLHLFWLLAISFSPLSQALDLQKSTLLTQQNQNQRFGPVDQVFAFSAFSQDQFLSLDWQIERGYYLYKKSIQVITPTGPVSLTLPDAESHFDDFFGHVDIYRQSLSTSVSLPPQEQPTQIQVTYQGCADAGFCYPPTTKTVDVAAFDTPVSPKQATAPATSSTLSSHSVELQDYSAAPASDTPQTQVGQHWWTPLLFVLFGIGLALTPCVLPMYPIVTSLVLGQGKLSNLRTFVLALTYVQGMAITYTGLGLVVASLGLPFQAALQQPPVLIGLSLLFIALAASMFGLYTLQLPSRLQTRVNQWSNQAQGGRLGGVFVMGMISGLVCSPCTTAPLSGALLYVAQTGNLWVGALTLYALAMGMGIPLILAAMFGQKLLPKTGAWMNDIKILFGFLLLAAPLFLLERLVPSAIATSLWAVLGLCTATWVWHRQSHFSPSRLRSAAALIAILGIQFSAYSLYRVWLAPAPVSPAQALSFTQVSDLAELETQLLSAKQQQQPVMIDFYADWCVACKEFEHKTFTDPKVKAALAHYRLLQIDVTANNAEDQAVLKRLDVLGLPTLDFWASSGELNSAARVSGFLSAEDFINHLEKNSL
ncbi:MULTISPECIES: protein-disulfide reductase DsbD [unclassified Vibrio]|uniref:Thiol:disulfide interchange protein DsbD n=1 Tax=Vibrio sp. HB236076 TaxID=3232307 RepID=A0AB39HBV2_9VIBR|nr:protein-disulfide reductase DsbD [Vibrio sp. HB161653]MDP5255444.1 protein-disulfide reductase DsbD [Vibrio sp. HB161653]